MKFCGVIPPLVTPFNKDSSIDFQGLTNLLEFQIEAGVHGLFILGTTGEGTSIPHHLQEDLIKHICQHCKDRIPILVSISDTSLHRTLAMAQLAYDQGAAAVVLTMPYYYPMCTEEIQDYLERVITNVELPLLLYNMPSCTKINLSVDQVEYAYKLGAVGIKDSSGDYNNLLQLMNRLGHKDDFSIIAGSEIYLPETIASGGHGVVAGTANIFPRLFVDWYDACLQQNTQRIDEIRTQILQIHGNLYSEGKIIHAIKASLKSMGICKEYMMPPLNTLNGSTIEKINAFMQENREHRTVTQT